MSAGAACFVQTCDQVITGRQFQYDRALEIIQDEEYLEDLDFDDIKRYDTSQILKKISEINPNFNIPQDIQYSNWKPIKNNENEVYKRKYLYEKKYNGKYSTNYVKYTNIFDKQQESEKENANFNHDGGSKKNENWGNYASPAAPQPPPGLKRQKTKNNKGETDFEPVFTNSDGQKVLSRVKRPAATSLTVAVNEFSSDFNGGAAGTQPVVPFDFGDTGFGAFGAFGAGMVGMAMTMPDLSFQQGGSIPAGAAGGGGLPTDFTISTAALSLALVPLGLAALAIFPPFARPRTVPAVAVIFSEARNTTNTIKKREIRRLYKMIHKRSSDSYSDSEFWIGETKIGLPSFSEIKYALQEKQPKTVKFLTKAWNSLSRFRVWIARTMYKNLPGRMKTLVKKFGRVEALLHKKLACIEPRLKRQYGTLVYPQGLTIKAIEEKKENFWDFVNNGNAEDVHVEYIQDCFDDMERPQFGWRAKVTVMKNEPCEFNFENPDQSTCRNTLNSDVELDLNHYAQSRQTGEGFRSAATPDCRVEYVCNTPLDTATSNRRNYNIQHPPPQPPNSPQVKSNQAFKASAIPAPPQPPSGTQSPVSPIEVELNQHHIHAQQHPSEVNQQSPRAANFEAKNQHTQTQTVQENVWQAVVPIFNPSEPDF